MRGCGVVCCTRQYILREHPENLAHGALAHGAVGLALQPVGKDCDLGAHAPSAVR